MCVFVCVYVSESVCVSVRKRVCMSERWCVSVYVSECVCVREKESLYVCGIEERERVFCVYVCEIEFV